MTKSLIGFTRWQSKRRNSWAFLVFKNQYTEIIKMHNAHKVASKYLGSKLNSEENVIHIKASEYFGDIAKNRKDEELFDSLEDWYDCFNIFTKWSDYSAILALSGNFEIYIDKVVSLSMESNIGLIKESPELTDGMKLIKTGEFKNNLNKINKLVIGCLKGTWYQRIDKWESIFNWKPSIFEDNANIEILENIRKIRNDAAHAYGRDIKSTRTSQGLEVKKLIEIDEDLLINYFSLVYKLSQEMDLYLIDNHIGEYHCLNFYHELRISGKINLSDQSNNQIGLTSEILRKAYGQYSSQPMGKNYYKQLIRYYENL